MLAMFLGASIPMMEKRSLERRPQYQAVIDRVPRLVPRPPRKAAALTRPRVVIAGLGDSGLLTAIRLARSADVVGISAKPALVSGQELGVRLTRPAGLGPRLLGPVRPLPRHWTGCAPCRPR